MLIQVCVMMLVMSQPNILPDPNALPLNEPATYCHGYLQMICGAWMLEPIVELYYGPAEHISDKLHLERSDGKTETIVRTVRLGKMDMLKFGEYAAHHPGGLKRKPPPIPPPSSPSKLEVLAIFAELLFMEND